MRKKRRRKKSAICTLTKRVKCKKTTKKKQQHSNQFIKSKKINKLKAQLYHLNNHSFKIIHLDLATQMKLFNLCMHRKVKKYKPQTKDGKISTCMYKHPSFILV